MCCYNILGFFTESSSLTNSDGIGSYTAIKTDSGNPVTQSEEDIEGQGDKNGMGEEHGDGAREDCLNGNDTGGEGEMEGGGETIRNREGEGGHNGKRTESTNTGGDSLCVQTINIANCQVLLILQQLFQKRYCICIFQLLKYLSIFHRIH